MPSLCQALGAKPGDVRVALLTASGGAAPFYDGRLVSGGEDYITLILSNGKSMLIATNAIVWLYYRWGKVAMKVIGLILLVAGLCAIDESYLDGRNTIAALDSFRATARVINRYVEDLLRPLRR
jgi:hypothetical protein